MLSCFVVKELQSNFNDSNTFITMKTCSRQGQFELIRVSHSTRPEGIIGIPFRFFNMKVCCVFTLELPRRGDFNEYTQ